MEFANSISFKNSLNFNFKEQFDGIEVWLNLYHTNKTNSSLYERWTFPKVEVMDQFYFEKRTNTLLSTPGMTVGKSSFLSTFMNLKFSRKIQKNFVINKRIFGIGITFLDRISNKIQFFKPLINVDDDGFLMLSPKYEEKRRNVNL